MSAHLAGERVPRQAKEQYASHHAPRGVPPPSRSSSPLLIPMLSRPLNMWWPPMSAPQYLKALPATTVAEPRPALGSRHSLGPSMRSVHRFAQGCARIVPIVVVHALA
eukprot:CAMPEP_0176443544 /NCGR_PEP_ID=MMETSP0127-20121128/22497_1 /TAXON_ID=938130 /ORGANISM="Platyophrya macrostoma, Strain WH" /LENGTH=107 /DNA_ID=CAMNT_0017828815 /DNA_START=107 /DNA_END=430 /DNA_ORIENTATION=+